MCNCNPTSSTSSGNGGVISIGNCGVCQDGADGTSSYTYVAFADEVTDQCDPAYATSGFSLTATGTAQWIGIITTSSPLTPPEEEDFECAWVQVAGAGVAGSIIEVQEEGVPKVTNPNILNFTDQGIAEVTVTQTIVGGSTVANIDVNAEIFEKVTHAQVTAYISGNDLIPGKLYWIYDVGDAATSATDGLNSVVTAANAYAGIILRAIATDRLDTNGIYIARVPDPKYAFWTNDGLFPIGSFVEHLNAVWTNPTVAQSVTALNPPSTNLAVWTRLSKDSAEYITKVFSCIYDVEKNQIYSITDTRDNTVTINYIDPAVAVPANELFYYCFRWTESGNVYGNKVTISNITTDDTGFVAAWGGYFPNLGRNIPTGGSFCPNVWGDPFYNNTIDLNFDKGACIFSSRNIVGGSRPGFYQTDSAFYNNTILNGTTYLNPYLLFYNNDVNECELGSTTGAAANIITSSTTLTYGQLYNCILKNCSIRNNTGKLTASDLVGTRVRNNNDLVADTLNGFLWITSNNFLSISDVVAQNRASNTLGNEACEITLNNNVIISDVTGRRYNMRSNTNLTISINIRMNNGNISENTGILNAICFDEDGTTPFPTTGTPINCVISQVELSNFSNIEKNTWLTAGGISRVTLRSSDIKNCIIDFRDAAWQTAGTPTAPATPPAIADFNAEVDGVATPIYLFQCRNKLVNPVFPFPSMLNGAAVLSDTTINGTTSGTNKRKPLLNAYTYDALAPRWNFIPYISSQEYYSDGVVAERQGGGFYVFLNLDDINVYDAALNGGTLYLPEWAQHASVLYLYDKDDDTTVTIARIVDIATNRPIHRFRMVPLSYGLTVNITTTPIATATATTIVSSQTPGVGAFTLFGRSDVFEFEKRAGINYVTRFVNMQ